MAFVSFVIWDNGLRLLPKSLGAVTRNPSDCNAYLPFCSAMDSVHASNRFKSVVSVPLCIYLNCMGFWPYAFLGGQWSDARGDYIGTFASMERKPSYVKHLSTQALLTNKCC